MRLAADLHIHSCLSPCADAEMTPRNIANMAKLKGLDIIAVADHNSALNVPAAAEAARDAGVMLIPAIEVQTREEAHVLCYFTSTNAALEFSEMLYNTLMPIQNRTDLFGQQTVMDAMDNVVGNVGRLLVQSSHLSLDEIVAKTKKAGGACVPAHINRSSNSCLASLGFIPKEPGFKYVEVARSGRECEISDYDILYSSDAHTLGDILEREIFLEIYENSAEAVVALLGGYKK